MLSCPVCGHENVRGVLVCAACGTNLYAGFLDQIATKKLDNARTRDLSHSAGPSSNPLVMYIRHENQPIAIERVGRVVLGRSTDQPDSDGMVDLSPYQAEDHGVSRTHFAIDTLEEPPLVIDLGSSNGTFINGQKLTPNRPYPLESGDEVRAGRLVMYLYYK